MAKGDPRRERGSESARERALHAEGRIVGASGPSGLDVRILASHAKAHHGLHVCKPPVPIPSFVHLGPRRPLHRIWRGRVSAVGCRGSCLPHPTNLTPSIPRLTPRRQKRNTPPAGQRCGGGGGMGGGGETCRALGRFDDYCISAQEGHARSGPPQFFHAKLLRFSRGVGRASMGSKLSAGI